MSQAFQRSLFGAACALLMSASCATTATSNRSSNEANQLEAEADVVLAPGVTVPGRNIRICENGDDPPDPQKPSSSDHTRWLNCEALGLALQAAWQAQIVFERKHHIPGDGWSWDADSAQVIGLKEKTKAAMLIVCAEKGGDCSDACGSSSTPDDCIAAEERVSESFFERRDEEKSRERRMEEARRYGEWVRKLQDKEDADEAFANAVRAANSQSGRVYVMTNHAPYSTPSRPATSSGGGSRNSDSSGDCKHPPPPPKECPAGEHCAGVAREWNCETGR